MPNLTTLDDLGPGLRASQSTLLVFTSYHFVPLYRTAFLLPIQGQGPLPTLPRIVSKMRPPGPRCASRFRSFRLLKREQRQRQRLRQTSRDLREPELTDVGYNSQPILDIYLRHLLLLCPESLTKSLFLFSHSSRQSINTGLFLFQAQLSPDSCKMHCSTAALRGSRDKAPSCHDGPLSPVFCTPPRIFPLQIKERRLGGEPNSRKPAL